MITIGQLLKNKGSTVWSVAPATTVYEALDLMAEKDIGALLVMEKDQVVGVFSERDYARKVILKGKSSRDTQIGELMTKDVLTMSSEKNISDCMKLMTDSHIRHIPVIDEGQLIGIITIGDVVNAIIKEQKKTIGQLEGYISGENYGA